LGNFKLGISFFIENPKPIATHSNPWEFQRRSARSNRPELIDQTAGWGWRFEVRGFATRPHLNLTSPDLLGKSGIFPNILGKSGSFGGIFLGKSGIFPKILGKSGNFPKP
jgi:hypothetical protein